MQNKYFFTLLYISVNLLFSTGSSAQNIYKTISASQCNNLIIENSNNPNFVILDVRTNTEWINEHLEGSINRSTRDADFEQQLDALPKHKIFLLHCQSGGRSAGAFSKMKDLGFSEVYEMQGGINSWKSNSFPTTAEHAPKIMLVQHSDILSGNSGTDTINITITNRANDLLTFSSASVNDIHEITHNFDSQKTLSGAEDYTFSVYHDPAYSEDDSTTIFIESNGGDLQVNIIFKNGIIQNIDSEFDKNEVVFYPNPAKNILYVKGIPANDIKEITFINLNGQLVKQENNISELSGINISELKAGIYFVQLKTNKTTYSEKIVVQQ